MKMPCRITDEIPFAPVYDDDRDQIQMMEEALWSLKGTRAMRDRIREQIRLEYLDQEEKEEFLND